MSSMVSDSSCLHDGFNVDDSIGFTSYQLSWNLLRMRALDSVRLAGMIKYFFSHLHLIFPTDSLNPKISENLSSLKFVIIVKLTAKPIS